MVVRDNASAPPHSRRAKPKRANCCRQPFSFRLSGPSQLISPPSLGLCDLIAIAILKLYILTLCEVLDRHISSPSPYTRRSDRLSLLPLYDSLTLQLLHRITLSFPPNSPLSILINYQSILHGAYHRVGDLTRSPVLS